MHLNFNLPNSLSFEAKTRRERGEKEVESEKRGETKREGEIGKEGRRGGK